MSKGFASNYRIVLLASGILVTFAGLGARLVDLHVINRGELMKFVAKARRQVIQEHARRGNIVDVNGNILATSRTQLVFGVDPQSLRKEDEAKWPELAQLLGVKLADLEKTFRTKTRTVVPPAGVTLKVASALSAPPATMADTSDQPEDVPAVAGAKSPFELKLADEEKVSEAKPEEEDDSVVDEPAEGNGVRLIRWAKLSDHVDESTSDKIDALGVRGVYGQRVYRRAYPHNQLAAHLIGYVNKAGEPASGVESYADFYLRGQDGWREGERDGRGREIAQFRSREVPAGDGYSVTLTIDTMVQHMVEEELADVVKRLVPEKATIIVGEPSTGRILALANYPSFNLNDYSHADIAAQRNVAVTDQYEPGSVFKIVAASAALENHLVTPETRFDCSIDRIEYKGMVRKLPGEDHRFDHPLSVAEIIAHSSNRGAAQLAMLLGEQRFYDYARAFGFGQRTGFPFGGEVRGLMASPNNWDGLTITRMPMGHSVAATPLQMHMAMSAIANHGVLMQPQIIKEIKDAAGETVTQFDPVIVRRVISDQTAQTMARLLMAVASKEGTAPEAAINYLNSDFEVAGKTGTTQKLVPVVDAHGRKVLRYSTRDHIASFVGFFPASNPRVTITVIVDGADKHSLNGVAYGAKVAAPSFKRIGEQLIQYLNDFKPPAKTTSGRNLLAMEGVRR
jgi:cell division protein FtsI/penicillin-binding protein 2